MSVRTEQAYDDFATWFENNVNRYPIVDQEKRWQFLVKAIEIQARIQAMVLEDLKRAEGRSPTLYTPSGLRIAI